jgi:peptidoglycan/xylan/chitin deacetylase (PgdA/CDA1 family)
VTGGGPPLSRRSVLAGLAASAAGMAAAACGGSSAGHPGARRTASIPPTSSLQPSDPVPQPPPSAGPPPDPASVGANELGVVPVLMHHRLVAAVDSEYDMTPAWWRAELERLHRERYYPVTMLQVARGDLGHVPAGRAPVVLTFDDSSIGQLHYDPHGAIAADSAVGMLVEFSREHPDFPAAASFYLNKDPFGLGQPRRAIGDLHRLGFEIGNHTYDHVPLDLPPQQIEQQLGELATMVEEGLPGLAPRTMALPLGVEPRHPALVRAGRWRGRPYVNEAVLLVGAEPAPSPFSTRWDAGAVPRIRSSSYDRGRGEFLSTWWLDRIARGEIARYVSAGNPGHVTFPKRYAARLAPRHRGIAVAY